MRGVLPISAHGDDRVHFLRLLAIAFALLFPLRGRWIPAAIVLAAALFGAGFILRLPTRPPR